MLFNSYVFIFLFLPVTLIVFFAIGREGRHRPAIAWLVGASLFYYGWWNPAFLGLIIASTLFNYATGVALARRQRSAAGKAILAFGVTVDLGILAYFKYAHFLAENINSATGAHLHFASAILPLGISFFTFQKIAYLVDAYRGEVRNYGFLQFFLFVIYFPQLIAGPIVHHKEIIPQFARDRVYRFEPRNLAAGLMIFFIGLFKKVILADRLAAPYGTPVFDAALHGITPDFYEAWGGALAYTLQLYFDFSGYSDMAIGASRMFGIRLPINFHSPYKAVNIIEFWRRWNITLSRFLRDYLYIPLGGNRHGPLRRYLNLFLTMLLGGLWHGAGWTFVFWGLLHGFYLAVNHAWHGVRRLLGHDPRLSSWQGRVVSRALTFAAVVAGWVFFRAGSWDAAVTMIQSMTGMHGFSLPPEVMKKLGPLGSTLSLLGWQTMDADLFQNLKGAWLIPLFLIIWCMPNTQQLMARCRPALNFDTLEQTPSHLQWIAWKPSRLWAALGGAIAVIALLNLSRVSEFLYYQF